jgi:hypothetical protein
MADMTPGDDEISEGSEGASKPCLEVEGNPEVSDEEAVLDLLGGGGVFKLLNEIRCLCNMKSGIASARLVPTNCDRHSVSGR